MEEYDYTTGPSDGTVTFDNTFNGSDIRGVFRIGVEHIVKAPTTLSRFGGYGTEVDQTITFDRVDIKLVNPNAGSGSAPANMLTFTSETSSTVIVDLSDDVIRILQTHPTHHRFGAEPEPAFGFTNLMSIRSNVIV